MIHQCREPLRRLYRCNAAFSQRITDDSMQRVVAMIHRHSLIQSNKLGGVPTGPQILDHPVFEFNSHGKRCGLYNDIVAARVF